MNDFDKLLHKQVGNLWLNEYQIEILNKYGLDPKTFNNTKELIFELEKILNENSNEELETLSYELSEFDYYNNTNK